MSDDLSSADYAMLVLLKIEDREISNTELAEVHGVRLVSPVYEKLNAAGYVVSKTDRRPYRHSLADKGRRLLATPLVLEEDQAEAGERRSMKEKQLWAALAATYEDNLRLRAAAAEQSGVEDVRSLDERIRAVYEQAADGPGAWVDLTKIRSRLVDVPKADLDKALEQMLDAPDVRLEPEVTRHRLGKREREASVRIGGEDRHKLAIGLR
ncbi:hypothetical protein GCM10009850_079420 [Nonomuraea monospora]|uniref:MarR family transcriptional regulator n=1 Tax=Nonomuraea monospora TaxID=568818 RepID=A0ABN3CSQ0_9ACTN